VAERASAEGREPKQPREGIYSPSRLERSISVFAITIASIGLGYLFGEQIAVARRVALGEMGVMTVGALLILTLSLRAYQTGG
jgi:hypothetical protein